MGRAKSITKALALSPGRSGFKIEDSLFENMSDQSGYNPNEWNPNLGFKEKGGYTTFIYRKDHLSIDSGPSVSS